MVVVSAYDPAWPIRAAAEVAQLREALGAGAQRIEHIGSTAIPGMAAKDLIDLQVSVADLDDAVALFDAPLRGLGYEPRPYEHDHVPAGCVDDPARWAKRFWRSDRVNLHVRVAGSPNERFALLFRDWMRAHPEAVPAYGAIKRSLAAAVPDAGTYTDVKDPIVDLVIVVADEWARDTRWAPFREA
jgi:GrpB-like predicted nucleotidyltransferase (UPF0157 family)